MINPKVFLSVSVAGRPPKRITIELYADTTPRTAFKFLSLCTGENISQLHYKNSTFHRICYRHAGPENQLMGLCQGGTLPNSSKEEIQSVYGTETKPENFIKKHDGFGTVSMVSPRGPQFFILTGISEINDGKHVVVGRVVDGVDAVWEIVNIAGSFRGEPLMTVVIVDCGEVREAPNISLHQKMSSKELARVISTSNETLVNSLKEILNAKKQLIEVDPEDFDLEDNESEEILGTVEHNLNHIFHLKAELCSLEKCQEQLLSHRRTKNSSQLMIIPEAAHPAKLVETSHQNTMEWNPHPFVSQEHESEDLSDAGPLTKKMNLVETSHQNTMEWNPHPFVSQEHESEDLSYAGPLTKKMPPKKKMNLVKTIPQNPAYQAQKKCLHCETTETPQWRIGPLGPKTLCNACGVKYRHGRLFPQYRPAMSPTFDPSVHSNNYKKIAEMSLKGMFGAVATTSTDEETESE